MNDKYLEKLGRIICNTYNIAQHDPAKVGKLINTTYRLLEDEYIRDCREEANKAQWDEDRIDVISKNGNDGLHYD